MSCEVPGFKHLHAKRVLNQLVISMTKSDRASRDRKSAVHCAEDRRPDAQEEHVGDAVEVMNVMGNFVPDRCEVVSRRNRRSQQNRSSNLASCGQEFQRHHRHPTSAGVADECDRAAGVFVLIFDDPVDEDLCLSFVTFGADQVNGPDAFAAGPVVHRDGFRNTRVEQSHGNAAIENPFALDPWHDDDQALVEAFLGDRVILLNEERPEWHFPESEQGADTGIFFRNVQLNTNTCLNAGQIDRARISKEAVSFDLNDYAQETRKLPVRFQGSTLIWNNLWMHKCTNDVPTLEILT